MNEEKLDRRVRKTKKALLDSLIELMSKKKINSITVKELTDLADVNRSTFYLYYNDIFDMVEKLETEMIDDFSEVFETITKENYNQDILLFYTYIFEYIKNNSKMCKILLGPDGDNSFIEKFKYVINQKKPPLDESIPQIKIHYLRPLIISGCIGVIQQWLMDDLDVAPEDMAIIVTDTIKRCVSSL